MTELDPRAFEKIAKIARAEAGLDLGATKMGMVHARLRRRLRSLGIGDYESYCTILEGVGSSSDDERRRLIEALTTNVTSFFREDHHFPILCKTMVEIRQNRLDLPLKIWSAGCSNGSEPVSICLALRAHIPSLAPKDIDILATDIDGSALADASENRYAISALPVDFEDTVSALIRRHDDTVFGLDDVWFDRIRYRRENLMTDQPAASSFDAVFCRNVTIYFDGPTSALVHLNLIRALRSGGLLCLGHSERLTNPTSIAQCERVGPTAYVKI